MTDRLTLAEVGPRHFQVIEPGLSYRLAVPGVELTLDVDRLRWTPWQELNGELVVTTQMLGTDAIDGVLSRANFNISSARARAERANLVSRAARSSELPWQALIEEFCQKILAAERSGQPSIDLRHVTRDPSAREIAWNGLHVPARHPSILFGDGGSLKSFIALFLAGELRRLGYRVGYFDWELEAEDHHDRLVRLFGDDLPEIRYVRCDRPLSVEVDRLRRIREQDGLDFAIYDSIAFACDGPPEAAEVAGRYFQAVRQVRVGSFHIAHVTKSEHADQRPFGSTFWHNGARATWFVKPADTVPGADAVALGIFPRKWNLRGQPPAVGGEFSFSDERIDFRRIDVGSVGDLADRLPIRTRMVSLLRRGALTAEAVAEELQADIESVRRTARRYREQFAVLPGGKLGLLERAS